MASKNTQPPQQQPTSSNKRIQQSQAQVDEVNICIVFPN